jgi:hypothetical protein
MKNIIKILIGKMKASLGLRQRSTQEEYTRLIEKFDVVKRIPVSVINSGQDLRTEGQVYDSHL